MIGKVVHPSGKKEIIRMGERGKESPERRGCEILEKGERGTEKERERRQGSNSKILDRV